MLFYSKMTKSEGIDTTERDLVSTNVESSKQCDICHFYFFKNRNFNYQSHVCNQCHGGALCAKPITDLKIITTKKGTFRVVSNILFDEIVCLLETSDLDEKLGYLKEVL